MSKPSLRLNILRRSVQRLLDDDERVRSVVMLSTRHRLFVPYVAFAGVALFIVAAVVGVEGVANRIALGGCGVAVAGLATTNHVVLADTTRGLVMCRSSRIRQYAKEVSRRLPEGTALTMVASTLITSDWKIDGMTYTLTKRWESAMRQLSIQS